MIALDFSQDILHRLDSRYAERLQFGVSLARYTAARLGGPADVLLEIDTIDDLANIVTRCWVEQIPYWILGGGSNVLISDEGLRGLVLINRARKIRFDRKADLPLVWAESGANFGVVARRAALKGLSGLEWAAGIPGTIGGAVVGNAGAHGGDLAGNLFLADILHRKGNGRNLEVVREEWSVEKLNYSYRNSILKQNPGQAVVLSASLKLIPADAAQVQAKLDELTAYRRKTQPPGASMGSMFKNPAGDFAGRLIEAVGLKGFRMGKAQISPLHSNFFINLGGATARDIYRLIEHAQNTVAEKTGIWLELEIDLLGQW